MIGKKRLALAAGSVTAAGAVATLVAGTTFGMFTATETSGNNVIDAGTVVVSEGTPASAVCNTTQNLVPGDASTGWSPSAGSKLECTYSVHYTGSADAALAVDVAVDDVTAGTSQPAYPSGTAPSAKSGLYDASGDGLQLQVTSGTTTYVSGTSYTDQAGSPQTLSAGTPVTDLLVSSDATNPTDVVFKIDYELPTTASNAYQGAASKVVLTFHAVQNGNNAVPGGCTVGQQCSDQTGFSWS